MSCRVHYLCAYADDKTRRMVHYWTSSLPKISYMASALKRAFENVTIVSQCVLKKDEETIPDYVNEQGICCRFIMNPLRNISSRKLMYIGMCWQILKYIIFNVKPNDVVVAYHSLLFRHVLPLARKIKKFKLVYEVNELYSALWYPNLRKAELGMLKNADGYVLITELLSQRLNPNLPYVTNHSTYFSLSIPKKDIGLDPDKIHIVYAGVVEPLRKAAYNAMMASKFLPDKYQLHILGFGKKEDIDDLKETIDCINSSSPDKIVYHGAMYGEEYDQFLSNCQIGLTCHTYDEKHQESADVSFPSKAFVYLQHNLHIVSFPLRCLEASKLGPYVTFARNFTPQALAKAIEAVDVSENIDGNSIISKFDNEFVNSLSSLISIVNESR